MSRRLGVPVAPVKCEGPASVLTFLGFELDTNQMVVRLPQAKLQRILEMVRQWVGKKGCRKQELESLLGHLQHTAVVVQPGRTLLASDLSYSGIPVHDPGGHNVM